MIGTGNGYFDTVTRTYLPISQETWADYSTWDSFTTWEGTYADGTQLSYTSRIFDAGEINKTNCLLQVDAGTPFTTTITYGDSVSGGAIVSPSTETVTPGQGAVPVLTGRYFQFTILQEMDSGNDDLPFIAGLSVELQSASNVDLISYGGANNLDTSTLPGTDGVRTFSQTGVGSYVDFFVQILTTGLTGTKMPVCYVDMSGANPVLNIYDADSYGKRTPMDCYVNVNFAYMPAIEADSFGNITEV